MDASGIVNFLGFLRPVDKRKVNYRQLARQKAKHPQRFFSMNASTTSKLVILINESMSPKLDVPGT